MHILEATASRCCSHPDNGDADVAEATPAFVSRLGQDPVEEPDSRSSLELCMFALIYAGHVARAQR